MKFPIPGFGHRALCFFGAVCVTVTGVAPAQDAAAPGASASTLSGTAVSVQRGDVQQVIPAVGTLAPRKTANLGSQVAGRVEEVFVDVGDTVKADEELLKLDAKFFQIDLDQRKAELEAAKVRAAQSRSTLTRHQEISAKNPQAISAQAVDEARSASELAQAQLAQSEQALLGSEERLYETMIRAPFAGVITERMVDPGDPVTTTFVTQVMKIEQLDELELLFTLPQELFGQVKEGAGVQFQVSGVPDLNGVGKVERVFPALDEATRTFRCRVIIENPELRFRPGMLMQVKAVVREAKGVLCLPKGAVFQRGDGDAVRVAVDSGFEERVVNVGLRGAALVEITDGLSEGDQVLLLDAAGNIEKAPAR
jgi:membrane fusion protein (multidrug efflux system)